MEKRNNHLNEIENWVAIQEQAAPAVVQVFAQIVRFNWREPYIPGEQAEQRGTGFFIDKMGHIVTSSHVVADAKKVWIHLPLLGQHILYVDVVSLCPDRDFALLKLHDADRMFLEKALGPISFLKLGDSDQVSPTDKVMILGYPLGQYGLKSATGIVSGRESGPMCSLIQITAPLNLGNSGGPMLDQECHVVGIAAATVQEAQNIGYVVPSNELSYVIEDMHIYKLVRKGTLGIQFHMASDDLASYFGNPMPAGLYVSTVLKSSTADQMGVQEGDMIYKINGNVIDAYGFVRVPWSREQIPLTDVVTRFKNDEQVALEVYHGGKRLEVKGPFKANALQPIRPMYPDVEPIDYETVGGVVVMQLTDNLIDELVEGMPDLVRFDKMGAKGEPILVVAHVMLGSLAHGQGVIAAGCIIAQVNGKAVATLREFRDAVRGGVATDFLTIKTDDHFFMALPLKHMLEDEERLAQDFMYPMSDLVKELRAQLNIK